MDDSEKAALLRKICGPIILVGSPLLLVLYYKAPNPPGDGHAGWQLDLLMTAISIASFLFGMHLCRKEFGWFFSKK